MAAVVDLAGELAEHLVGLREAADYLARVAGGRGRAASTRRRLGKALPGEAKMMRDQLLARAGLLPIVERYRAKRSRDALDFADQVALAARLAGAFPDVGAARAGALPGGAARRVPGHQRGPAGAAAPAVRGAREPSR